MISAKERLDSIKQEYIHGLRGSIAAKESSLADPNWASNGDEYHIECRLTAMAEIKFLKSVIKKIQPK
jgi:hypothetical protein